MFDKNETLAFLRLVQSERRTNKESLTLAAVYASQLVISSVLLFYGYEFFHAKAAVWAVVSAVLVLQPGVEQSVKASAVRVAANFIGGLSGLAVGTLVGVSSPDILVAMVITVIFCELLRLDLGLRTACVATLIVMRAPEGFVITSSEERWLAVLIGCLTAVAVQLLMEYLRRTLGLSNAKLDSMKNATATVAESHRNQE